MFAMFKNKFVMRCDFRFYYWF